MAFDPNLPFEEEEDEITSINLEPSRQQGTLAFDPTQPFEEEDEESIPLARVPVNRNAPWETFQPKPKEVGTLEGIANAARNAFDSSRQAMDVVGGVTPEEAKNISKIEYDKQSRKLAPGYDEYQKAEGMDAVWAFAKNPIEVTSNIIAEGLAGSLPALGAGLAAGGAGALIGAPTGIGAPIGFTAGQIAGTFAGSLATEYGGKILEELQNEGMDIKDPESINKFFANQTLVDAAKDKALKRGVPIAAFDAISAGIGGKLGRVIGKQFVTKTGEAAAELGVQAALGGGGEVAGALAAGEPIEGKAVFGEIIGETGGGISEIITGRIADRQARLKAQEDARIKAASELSTTLEENSAPLTAAAVKSTTATTIEQDKLAAQLEEQLDAEELVAVKEPTAAPTTAIPTKDDYVARYSAIAQVAPEELTRAEQSFTSELATADTEEARANAQNALEAIKEVKATITPLAPTVEPTITPAVTPAAEAAQPTPTYAAEEIIQPEGVRQEPQDGTQVRPTEEAGVSDSLQPPARGEEEGQVAPTPEPIISEIPATSELVGAEPTQPTIREVPEISPIVGAEPAAIVEQEPVAPAEPAQLPIEEPAVKISRGENFSMYGEYNVSIGDKKHRIYRDPERGYWYDADVQDDAFKNKNPERGSPFLGLLSTETRKDAIAELVNKYKEEQQAAIPLEAPTPVTTTPVTEAVTPAEAPAITPAPVAETPAVAPAPAIPIYQGEEAIDKAVEGTPHIAIGYHGGKKEIDVVDPTKFSGRSGEGWLGIGFYSAPAEDTAASYGPKVTKVKITLKNPFVFPENTNPIKYVNEQGGPAKFTEKLKEQGYDGVISKNVLRQIVAFYPESVSTKLEAATPSAPAAEPAGISVGNRIKLGKSPQTYTIEEVIPQSATERELGEQYYSVKNERTGETQVVEARDLKQVKGKGARKIAAETRSLEDQIAFEIASDYLDFAEEMASKNRTPFKITGNEQKMVRDFKEELSAKVINQDTGEPDTTHPSYQKWKALQTRTGSERVASSIKGNAIRIIKSNQKKYSKLVNVMGGTTRNEEYMRLAQDPEANREQLQRMVDEAAKKAGYTTPATHGSSSEKEFTIFDTETSPFGRVQGSYFTKNLKGTWAGWVKSRRMMRVYLRFENPATEKTLKEMGYRILGADAKKWLTDRGYDGVIDDSMDEVVAFSPNQIKSADPVTYDDAGNVIPLEERFQPTSPDIRRQAIDTTPEGILTTPPDQQYTFNEVFDVAYDMFGGEIPEGFTIVNDSKDKDFEFKAAYIPESGEIIVNLAYLNKSDDIRDTITHELGHYIFGDPEFRAAFDQFIASLSPEARADLDAYVETAYNKETGEIRLEEKMVRAFVDQFINEEQAPAWRSMLDAIKRFLNKLGFKFNISDRDAISVFTAALDRYKAGEAISREGGARKIIDDLTAMDAEYLAAVEEAKKTGDLTKVQRMVDEAAKSAGFTSFNEDYPTYASLIEGVRNGQLLVHSRRIKKSEIPDLQYGLDPTFGETLKSTEAAMDAEEMGIEPAELVFAADNFKWAGDGRNGMIFVSKNGFQKSLGDGRVELADGKIVRYENSPIADYENDALRGEPFGVETNDWYSNKVAEVVGASPFNNKSADPVTYDDAGDVIPLSQRFRPTSPDIRRMAAEPRTEQVAGRTDRGTDIITTPVGIIKQTNEVLRKNFFDGTTVSGEATKNAWLYISRLLDIESGNANELAGQINDTVDVETNSDSRMGASLFSVSLANYAAKLAALGDSTMLSFLVRRINKMPVDKYAGGRSEAGEALRGAREYDIDGYGALKVEQQAKRDRTAAEIFARGNPTKEQVDAVSDAIDAADNATIGTPEEVASDVEQIEKRTKRNITKKLETLLKKGSLKEMIASIKNTPLEEQQAPGWIEKVIKGYLEQAGLTGDAATTAAKLYDSILTERFVAAKQKAFEETLNRSAPWKNYLSRNSRMAKDSLKKIQVAIRTGVLDPSQNIESVIAKENGWDGFTKEQFEKIVQLDNIINNPDNDDVTRREAMSELNKVIVDAKLPVRFKDALGAYYVGNALMGIPTGLVNLVSPAGFAIRNMMTDIGRYAFTDPARIPIAFESFLDSMRSWYDQTSYAFKNQIYLNDVVEYLQGQNVLRELFDKGKKQWANGEYAAGFVNMAVGMTQITGRVLSSLDQGAIAMLENQNITRYAMEALAGNTKGRVPKDKLKEFANMVLHTKRRVIAESVASGMPRDRAGVLADLAVKSEVISALASQDANPRAVLDASINDALLSVGRNKAITIKGAEKENTNLSDEGMLSYLPISFLQTIASSAARQGSGMQIFSKMLYGFALVPARVFHNVAWFSPYGFLRLGIDAYKKNRGQDSPYAMSLQTEAQFKQRLTEAIAGSIVMIGLMALRAGSSDDEDDKLFKIVITGNGPSAATDKQYHDTWNKMYSPYTFHIIIKGQPPIKINIGRGGEALFFPILMAGAMDDWEIKKKQNDTKKSPEDLNMAASVLGSAFFALAQRGPYAAFGKSLFDGSKQGRITEELASQAGYFGKTFIPVFGTSVARNITDFINDPVDRSSIEGAIYANTPIVGPWMGAKALNALGQPVRADDWGDKLYKLGVPVVFSFPKDTPMNELNELILKQGSGPTFPTRTNAQKRFGDILTDKEFETYVREYGKVMSDRMFKNRTKLARMKPSDYDDELEKYARGYSAGDFKVKGASDAAVQAVKRMRQ